MQLIRFEYGTLVLSILCVIAAAGLLFFFLAMRSKNLNLLRSITLVVLIMGLFSTLLLVSGQLRLMPVGMDLLDRFPVRILYWLNSEHYRIVGLIFQTFFIVSMLFMLAWKQNRFILGLFWALVFVFNLPIVIQITWYYFTWKPTPIPVRSDDIGSIIFEHIINNRDHILFSLIYPLICLLLSVCALLKIHRTR